MEHENIQINIPESLVKKYFPFLYQFPRIYVIIHFLIKPLDEVFRAIYLGFIPLVAFLGFIYWIIPKSNPSPIIILQNYLILILAILLLCTVFLLIIESHSRKIITDTHAFRRLLQDRFLTRRGYNIIGKFDLNSIIPILAIKKI